MPFLGFLRGMDLNSIPPGEADRVVVYMNSPRRKCNHVIYDDGYSVRHSVNREQLFITGCVAAKDDLL